MMAKSASIQKMSSRHESILQFLIANPTKKMSEVAAHFGVTPAWMSTIVHSDAFQDQLARRHDEMFDVAIVQELGGKVAAAANLSIDEYLDKIPLMTPDQLISGTDKLLGKLGYGTKNGGGIQIGDGATVQINQGQVAPDVVERAREKIGKGNNIDGESEVGATDSETAVQDELPQIAAQTEGDRVREESESESSREVRPVFIYPEPVVQVPEVRGQDKVLPD